MKGTERALIEKMLAHVLQRATTPEDVRATLRALSHAAEVFSSSEQRSVFQDALMREQDAGRMLATLEQAIKQPLAVVVVHELAKARALGVLPRLLERLRGVAADRGIVRFARVEAAVMPSREEHVALQASLEKRWNVPVELEIVVRPALLGGYRLRSLDWMLDASVLGRIRRMASALTERAAV